MYGLIFNERITDVVTGDHGLPTAWTWRGSRYTGGEVIERWVTTAAWWRGLESLAPDAPSSIQHFVLHASSAHGVEQLQLAHDDATMTWRLIGVLGSPRDPSPRDPSPRDPSAR
jgi:uncharacterized protein DUF6504